MADYEPKWKQFDPYGDKIYLTKFDWRDEEVMKHIRKFLYFGKRDSKGNIKRQHAIQTGKLLRSIGWKAWAESGGDAEVFQETYLKYGQFVELAVSKGKPFRQLPPGIPARQWSPIKMPDRRRRAKPHSTTEMRKQANKFERIMVNHFAFVGLGFLVYAAGANRANYEEINRLMLSQRK